MPWSIFPKGVADLPVVLSGPIVRMVMNNKVLVWLALKGPHSVKLEVRDGAGNLVTGTFPTITPLKLGPSLYVAVAKAEGLSLSANTKYFYDIVFDISGTTKTLNGAGILNNQTTSTNATQTSGAISKITFGSDTRPSFITPPSNINDLRFLHGSCRKPHANKAHRRNVDALYGAHKLLEQHFNNPSSILRPHQLFMTGDQIYADDVADELLFYCQQIGNTLITSNAEPLVNGFDSNYLKVRNRSSLRTEKIYTFTSTKDKNHLLTLREFYSMYLLVWSDAVFPTTRATATDVYGSSVQNDLAYDFEDEASGISSFLYTLPFIRKALANISTYMVCDDHEITDDLFLNFRWCYEALGYPGTDPTIASYISTFFPTVNTEGNELSKRVISNGLTAFNVFQFWGNYDLDGNTEFALFKTKVENVANDLNANIQKYNDLQSIILPSLSALADKTNCDIALNGNDYHGFRLDFGSYQVVFINSRTQRGYVLGNEGNHPAQLISWDKIQQQIGQYFTSSSSFSITIVVAAAPFLGYVPAEQAVEGIVQSKVINKGTDLAQSADVMDESLETKTDFESWGANAKLRERVLDVISAHQRVVFISGDVHYGFTNKIDYWNNRGGFGSSEEKRSIIVQLTASSFKNEAHSDSLFGAKAIPESTQVEDTNILTLLTRPEYEFAGWVDEGRHIISAFDNLIYYAKLMKASRISPVFTELRLTALAPFNSVGIIKDKTGDPPDWSYRITRIGDTRDDDTRSTYATANLLDPKPLTPFSPNLLAAWYHRTRKKACNSYYVPGYNNIGLVSFGGFPTTPTLVHEFLFSFAQDKEIAPTNNMGTIFFEMYTRHIVDLAVSQYVPVTQTSNNPRPGY